MRKTLQIDTASGGSTLNWDGGISQLEQCTFLIFNMQMRHHVSSKNVGEMRYILNKISAEYGVHVSKVKTEITIDRLLITSILLAARNKFHLFCRFANTELVFL